jgi:predicted RNA binding protein YcfA (HicA-like mRNA interferase family)
MFAWVVYILHMHSRDIIRKLEADGWQLVAVKGSHHQFKHPSKPGRVTLVHPRKDTPIGTVKSMEKQSGIMLR